MSNWWDKYKKEAGGTQVIKGIADNMMEMSKKIEDKFWEKESEIYLKHGKPPGSPCLDKVWRKKVNDLIEEEHRMIHPLWVQISEIYDYLITVDKPNG